MKRIDWNGEKIEQIIGYKFKDKDLLKKAFIHSTYSNIHDIENNERLEFLGDSVLQLVVSERLYFRYNNGGELLNEGKMTDIRQKIVCKQTLYNTVIRLGIKDYLLIEGGDSNVGDKTISSLFETVTAAIYLDGGYKEAERFIIENLTGSDQLVPPNYKGQLQEWLQKHKFDNCKYFSKKFGKDNDPDFICVACANGIKAEGRGKTKIQAEQNSAEKLLKMLKESK